MLYKNWLKQQLMIEYFHDPIKKQWSDSKGGYHQKEKNDQVQNQCSQFKIGDNQKNEKNYFYYTEVKK